MRFYGGKGAYFDRKKKQGKRWTIPHFDGQSFRRLIFEDDFAIICQDKVAAEVNILAERKEKQYVSDNAQLMEEWNYARNVAAGIEPWEITYGSAKKVWWKCAEGHEWEAPIIRRTSKGQGCPICANNNASFRAKAREQRKKQMNPQGDK